MTATSPERFCAEQRRRWLAEAACGVRDVLVVGGGITGAGVAREAALRGLDVCLLERRDFASGTSSRSSKLIHGGLRYLAQGDIALVREAARERATLRKIAPHLARPLRMLIPARSLPARVKLAAGLWTFDKLAGKSDEAGYEILDHGAVAASEPAVGERASAGGGIVFTEYATNDARLVLETLQSAAAAGARVMNYAAVTGVRSDGDGLRAVVKDTAGGGALEIRARCLVNAAGPWFDAVNELVEAGGRPSMQLTKGIHIVVPYECIPVRHLVVLHAPDGRSAFVVPAGDRVYVGTTDTLYSGEPEEPPIASEDVDYLLDSVNDTIDCRVSRRDIVGSWCGVRPLLKQEGKSPSEISRRDEIRVGPGPVVSVAGGKLTTYRSMAERVADAVIGVLRDAPEAPNGRSADRPLAGGTASEQAAARAAVPTTGDGKLDDRLWSTYGVAASGLVSQIAADPASGSSVGGLLDVTRAEIEHALRQEMALTVDDVLRRRLRAGMFDVRRACEAADDVARLMGSFFGWDETRCVQEAVDFRSERLHELSVARGEPVEDKS